MTVRENTALRAFEILKVLAESPDGRGTRSGIWQTIIERVPLLPEEAERTSPGRNIRGMTNYTFASDHLVNAEYLVKVQRGVWEITPAGRAALDAAAADPTSLYAEATRLSRIEQLRRGEELDEALQSTIVPPDDRARAIRAAARLFTERGLRDLDSVFVPGRQAWRADVIKELAEGFRDQPVVVGSGYADKLLVQLRDVSDDAKLLMAEIVAWHVLPLEKPGEIKKRARIQQIIQTMNDPVIIPADIDQALKSWSFDAGRGIGAEIDRGLAMIVNGLQLWIDLDADDRQEALDNPWAWRDFVTSIPGTPFPTQRNELLYLVHPESFGEVVAPEHRLAIRNTFIGEIGESATGDLDQDLRLLTIALQVKEHGPALYYREPLREIWSRSEPPEPKPDPLPDEGERDGSEERSAFPRSGAALAATLHIAEPWLDRVLGLIERRRQVILYGPPGTGKTFLAQALAEHVTKTTTGDYRIVQFHPTYSYEDFFEGFRPVVGADGQQLGFGLRKGPLRRLADGAAANPEANYFLVIDEINRGNLAKIFGELYYLLEYRDREISLLYSDEPFTLPANIFFIGTMNTADRSIAMLDAAMRRRFAFIELHPDTDPVRGLLGEWMLAQPFTDDRSELLVELNRTIADYDAKIGPSFLMRDLQHDGIESVWTYEILPLLAEHHYADGTDVEKAYGVPALRRALARARTEIADGAS
ncbi:hypothetical protein B7R21_07610 [Subtercola boreus]|uniref:AAA+ ATPase domain-containing protein n=1 Tax=Subtercola boreus TaxID=120213 RepID=A0A3E0VX39_9MICO|nr:AAA family ATPase [Subtercola boreus]RFA13918.1 hypothetical protein B7R21_07610 [Subtercola boreus]